MSKHRVDNPEANRIKSQGEGPNSDFEAELGFELPVSGCLHTALPTMQPLPTR